MLAYNVAGYHRRNDAVSGRNLVHDFNFLQKIGLTKMSNYTQKEIDFRLQNYFKFMFTRNPLERVLSAYKSKLLDNTTQTKDIRGKVGRAILKKYRKDVTKEQIESGSGVQFHEFLDYILETKERYKFLDITERLPNNKNHSTHRPTLHDSHWDTLNHLCLPCEVNYDFYGKFDTFKTDVSYILSKLGLKGCKDEIPELFRTRVSHKSYNEYYDKLSNEKIQTLADVYKNDYMLFGYRISF